LLVSQALTLFTTPVINTCLDWLSKRPHRQLPARAAAEEPVQRARQRSSTPAPARRYNSSIEQCDAASS
jgi:hypothetical protein